MDRIFLIHNGPLVEDEWQSPKFYSGEDQYKVYINPKITKIIDPVIIFYKYLFINHKIFLRPWNLSKKNVLLIQCFKLKSSAIKEFVSHMLMKSLMK
jgi:hypothetical protein